MAPAAVYPENPQLDPKSLPTPPQGSHILTIPHIFWLLVSTTAWSALTVLPTLQSPGLSAAQLRALLPTVPRLGPPSSAARQRALMALASTSPYLALVAWELAKQRLDRKIAGLTTIAISAICAALHMNLLA